MAKEARKRAAAVGAKESPGPKSSRRPRARKLAEYTAKRDFNVTPEPRPEARGRSAKHAKARRGSTADAAMFMVHKHDASRLHYDLRLEIDGVLASWAVPKGPSLDPAVKRLAVETEDHPLAYGEFEGRIPDDAYGGGDSLIWDKGTFKIIPPGSAAAQREKGHLQFELSGEKLKGRWHLVRTRGGRSSKAGWLLFKAHDEQADPGSDVVASRPESVVSGRRVTRGKERRKALRAPHPPPSKLLEALSPPMLATLVTEPPPDSSAWVFEPKYDGVRLLAAVSGGEVAVFTRNSLDWSARVPHLCQALSRLVIGDAVIDGEVVVLDDRGAPSFELLQQGHHRRAKLFAFDLLWLDGHDLRQTPLEDRRDLLVSLLGNAPPGLAVVERLDAEKALATAEKRGFEGIIAKRQGSRYEGARSGAWLKVKLQKAQELAVVGFTPNQRHKGEIGALLLAYARRGALHFAGKVGTGFTSKERRSLLQTLSNEVTDAPPVRSLPALHGAHWVAPRLVCDVRFTAWTEGNKLRHPSFRGLRPDKTPAECVREVPKKAREAAASTTERPRAMARAETKSRAAHKAPEAPAIKLTHPDKLLYPRDKITKQDVADYYEAVSGPLLRAIADRPLALEHFWEGIDAPPLFRQHLPSSAPAWVKAIETPARTREGSVRHLAADRPETLRWLAQQAALSIHMWLSRAPRLEEPSFALFDLDPADGRGVEQTIQVALVLHRLLSELSIPTFAKTSGKRGLHVMVPLLPGHTYEEVLAFTTGIGALLASKMPEITLERPKEKRKGRVYFDCCQNAYGKTVVAPYSLRAMDGAPVSAPLDWSEVHEGLAPERYNLRTMPERLAKKGDLFLKALTSGVRLPRLR